MYIRRKRPDEFNGDRLCQRVLKSTLTVNRLMVIAIRYEKGDLVYENGCEGGVERCPVRESGSFDYFAPFGFESVFFRIKAAFGESVY